MNFLAAVMPGVREIRTPLAVGALWLVAFVLWLGPNWSKILAGNGGLDQAYGFAASMPSTLQFGALGFSAYLLGCVTQGVASGLGSWVAPLGYRILHSFLKKYKWTRRCRPRVTRILSLDASRVRGPVADYVAAVFARVGAPGAAHFCLPLNYADERLESTALQLWQTAPAQAQEFDRLRTEAEFRGAVISPLAAIAVLAAALIGWWLLVPGVIAVTVLGVQAARLRHRSAETLANCLYLGYVKIPMVEALADELVRMELPPNSGDGAWAAATEVALERLAEFEIAGDIFDELASMLNQQKLEEYVSYHGGRDNTAGETARKKVDKYLAHIEESHPGLMLS